MIRERRAEARRLADEDAGKDEAEEATVSADENTTAEKAMAEEVTAEKAEKLNTPAVEVETVSKETGEKEHVPSIDDEFCSNDIYSHGNPSLTPSSRVSSSAPSSTYRRPGFDYWTLPYNDSE